LRDNVPWHSIHSIRYVLGIAVNCGTDDGVSGSLAKQQLTYGRRR
jgi:hypothetical protein